MYFLGAAELLSLDTDLTFSTWGIDLCPLLEAINFCKATCPLGARFLSVVQK